jgi:hypothetical protein
MLHQVEATIVELDDAGHQAIHARRHDQGDAHQHRDLLLQGRTGHRTQGDGDDLGREDEVGAHGILDLVRS